MKVIPERWVQVDEYVNDTVVHSDAALTAALQASASAGLPAINVTPSQGKLLRLLAQMHHARSMLEIGTLGGYSTIWLARALPPGGRLITLELNPQYAEVARANIARANLSHAVEFQVGSALELLPRLTQCGPFDFTFIDA